MAKDSVVKIDSEILKEVESFILKNKYQYSSLKQVINLAVLEFLNSKSFSKSVKRGK